MNTHFVRACAVETHVKILHEPPYAKISRKNARPRTTAQTVCKPAQSKRMSRFHRSHFIRKFTGKMPQPRLSPERGHTLCASLRSRNACQDFTRATLCENFQEKCAPQNHGADGMQACAVEPHVKISQEPLHTEIYRKIAATQIEPRTRTHTLCEPAQSKRMSRFYTRRFIQKFTGNRPQKRVSTLIKHQASHLLLETLSVDALFGEECFYILAAK